MTPSLHRLLHHLIDYAGLFPPAALPLDEAIRHFLSYLPPSAPGVTLFMVRSASTPERAVLGRLDAGAIRLSSQPIAGLARNHGDLLAQAPPFAISALGRGGTTTEEFLTNLQADVADLKGFAPDKPLAPASGERGWGEGEARVDLLEVRLPPDALTAPGRLDQILEALRETRLTIFVEAIPDRATLPALLDRLRLSSRGEEPVGFKLRCGGLEARAFPSSEQVAVALSACVTRGVPFKATAGLHHPLPRYEQGIQARMHGFVNLFVAGVLAHAGKADAATIERILDDSDPTQFLFQANGLAWNGLFVSNEEIVEARTQSVLSLGSCSFDDPRNDLRALGWL